MTDCEKCLLHLTSAGNKGIHSFTLNSLVGTFRVAARINDLKAKGYNITSIREKMGDAIGVRYFLQPKITKDHQTAQKPTYKIVLDNRTNTARRLLIT